MYLFCPISLNKFDFVFSWGPSDDRDHRESRYGRTKHGSLNDRNAEVWLDTYKESSALELSSLSTDALRDLPISELARKVTQKYKTGFELGRPFFGLQSEGQDKERGTSNYHPIEHWETFLISGEVLCWTNYRSEQYMYYWEISSDTCPYI